MKKKPKAATAEVKPVTAPDSLSARFSAPACSVDGRRVPPVEGRSAGRDRLRSRQARIPSAWQTSGRARGSDVLGS
ncbi:hypothetical protein AMK29_27210 [Streptomyces sp. CB02261]|nr:hypothetical protein AMK29_27210 [Streptomyces sp. CB02261]